MCESATKALVIVDAEGNYYVLPGEVISLAKAAPEAQDAIAERLASHARVPLAEGYSFAGVLTVPAEDELAHYTPDVAWPNAADTP
ncbi:hypothetical protein AB0A70_24720 [Streptomyces morookaense]|uniref:hypothetical protein n=1 Tax=Streptomyces morookaense TaxID=1970 RepID=UPI003407F4A3